MGSFLSSIIGSPAVAVDADIPREPDSSYEPSRLTGDGFPFLQQVAASIQNSKQLNELFMEPAVKEMAAKYTDVDFAKIYVYVVPDVWLESMGCKVCQQITFVLLKQGKEVDSVVESKKDELEMKIVEHRESP